MGPRFPGAGSGCSPEPPATAGGHAGDMSDANTTSPALPAGPTAAPGHESSTDAPGGSGSRPARLFRRSRADSMLAGVCGGAGRALGVDPVLVRLAMAGLALFGVGLGVVLYLICWVIVPVDDGEAASTGAVE